MLHTISNIHALEYQELESRGAAFRALDLSGGNLGVRVEEIPPGATSSYPHYHSLEEEHVLVLAGSATLHLGSDQHELIAGDHICFPAAEPVPHHIENRSPDNFKYLVFGEKKAGDVVFYPQERVLLVKALGAKLFNYEPS